MPNPLLVPQASQVGLTYGQNIVSGFIDAAQGTANLVSSIQDIQMKPEKFELQKQQTEAQIQSDLQKTRIDQARLELDQQKNVQAVEQFELEYDAKQKEFALETRLKEAQIRNYDSQVGSRNTAAGAGLSDSKKKQLFDNVTDAYLLEGKVDALVGMAGDISTPAGRRRNGEFIQHLVNKSGSKEEREVVSQFVSRARDQLAAGEFNPQQKEVMERTLQGLDYGLRSKFLETNVDKMAANFFNASGIIPDKKKLLQYEMGTGNESSLMKIYELDPATGKRNHASSIDTALNPDNKQIALKYIAAQNALRKNEDMELDRIRKSAQAASRIPRGGSQQQQSAEERPAKQLDMSTPAQRVGRLPTKEEGVKAESETKREIDIRKRNEIAKIRARNKLREIRGEPLIGYPRSMSRPLEPDGGILATTPTMSGSRNLGLYE